MGVCSSAPALETPYKGFYELQALDIDKQPVDFSSFKGKARAADVCAPGARRGYAVMPAAASPPSCTNASCLLPPSLSPRWCWSAAQPANEAATATRI